MLHVIDTLHLGQPHRIAAYALELADGLALIDCGPDSVFETLVAGIRSLGRQPEDVRHVLFTHVHLDHAGGAWRWAREFGATVYVHPRGAAHLLDPSRLLASATRLYGERMGTLWGSIEPLPADRLQVIEDGARVPLGGVELQAIATPGHASHHHAYWAPAERMLFAGDVAGIIIEQGPVLPPCPPPDIDVEAWCDSLARLRAFVPAAIYVTHYGPLPHPARALEELPTRLLRWAAWMRDRLREGREEATLGPDFEAFVLEELRALGIGEDLIKTYGQADPAAMSVAGLARYWRRRRPEAL